MNLANLRQDLEMAQRKAAMSKRNAILARDKANLAVEYAVDCEMLLGRALENLTKHERELARS
jgi:hypothetical protein